MPNRSINLTFHGVGRPERALEPGEELVWVSRQQFLALLDAAQHRHDVRITFDDGNASDIEMALPALRERGLSATFFVVAGRLGTPAFLDEDGVLALAEAGMRIGCHGMHHRPWRGLGRNACMQELIEARTILERVVQRAVTHAACPFGSYDRRVLRALQGSGYRYVYTSDRGSARPDAFIQPRNSVRAADGPDLLERIAARESSAQDARPAGQAHTEALALNRSRRRAGVGRASSAHSPGQRRWALSCRRDGWLCTGVPPKVPHNLRRRLVGNSKQHV